MAETMHGSDKPKVISGEQPLFVKENPPFQGGMPPFGAADGKSSPAGMPPLGKMPHGLGSKPSEGWQPPMADVSWVKRK